jgi:hypothetical protein
MSAPIPWELAEARRMVRDTRLERDAIGRQLRDSEDETETALHEIVGLERRAKDAEDRAAELAELIADFFRGIRDPVELLAGAEVPWREEDHA